MTSLGLIASEALTLSAIAATGRVEYRSLIFIDLRLPCDVYFTSVQSSS